MVTAWNKINPSWPGKNAMCERRFKQHSDMKCAPGVHQCNPHKTKDAMGGGGGHSSVSAWRNSPCLYMEAAKDGDIRLATIKRRGVQTWTV